jgi:hypothetical protein
MGPAARRDAREPQAAPGAHGERMKRPGEGADSNCQHRALFRPSSVGEALTVESHTRAPRRGLALSWRGDQGTGTITRSGTGSGWRQPLMMLRGTSRR